MYGAADMQVTEGVQFVAFVASVCLVCKLLKFVLPSDQSEVFFVVTIDGNQTVVGRDQKPFAERTFVSSVVSAYGC